MVKYQKFLRDIDNLRNIMVVEENDKAPKSQEADNVALQLTEYFDCDKFLQKGAQIIENRQKLQDKFENFIVQY